MEKRKKEGVGVLKVEEAHKEALTEIGRPWSATKIKRALIGLGGSQLQYGHTCLPDSHAINF